MKKRAFAAVLAAACGLAPVAVSAQQQVVRPPIATYWISAETAAGMGGGVPGMGGAGGGMADAMRMAMGGGAGNASRSLLLQLGSTRPASGEPRAAHEIPAGLKMGASLPLLTPRAQPASGDLPTAREDVPTERPRGRIKLYWGCGEQVRAGQPVVIDMARLGPGQAPPNIFASRARGVASGPSPSSHRTFGGWPNEETREATVPADGSLRGDHAVRGNYSPDIRFAIGDRHDFLAPVAVAPIRNLPSGAIEFRWQPIANATGYFASTMGARDGDEMVIWTSSEVQEWGGNLFDWLPPGEVARLIREKVAMPTSTTQCVLPAQVVRETGGMPMLRFIAWGDDLDLVHPPRPQDPRQPWEQQWVVKVRARSTAMLPLAEGMAGGGDPARSTDGTASRGAATDGATSDDPARQAQDAVVPDAVREGARILRGIFGR